MHDALIETSPHFEADLSTVADGCNVPIQCTVDCANRAAFTGPLGTGGGGQALAAPHPCLARW